MHEAADPYAILQVPYDATPAEVRAAFRRLAREHHPDRVPGSEPRMVALNWAYALLGDPARRKAYDDSRAVPARPTSPPQADVPTPDAGEVDLWGLDLDGHADDWRQMYEEERLIWEQLVKAHAIGTPDRARFERELRRAKTAQLALENALRAREGFPPLAEADFERQRSGEIDRARAATHAGCLGLLLAACLPLSLVSGLRRHPR